MQSVSISRMPIRTPAVAALAVSLSVLTLAQAPRGVDKDSEKWVQSTLRKMSVEEKVGQLIVPSFQSTFMSTDSAEFEALVGEPSPAELATAGA